MGGSSMMLPIVKAEGLARQFGTGDSKSRRARAGDVFDSTRRARRAARSFGERT